MGQTLQPLRDLRSFPSLIILVTKLTPTPTLCSLADPHPHPLEADHLLSSTHSAPGSESYFRAVAFPTSGRPPHTSKASLSKKGLLFCC